MRALILLQGLESWSTAPEYRAFFRQKLWGGFQMLSHVTFNRDKWMAALLLDPDTGLDPPGVKVRAAEGLDAASSFIQGYWLWCVMDLDALPLVSLGILGRAGLNKIAIVQVQGH